MDYHGLKWISVVLVLTGATQTDAYCESVEVEEASNSGANGIYTEQYGLTCDSSRYVYQKGQTFLYHMNAYWMISNYDYCLDENDSRLWARVYDSSDWPEYITNYWEELYSNGWYPNAYLKVNCNYGTIVGISLGSVFGLVAVISIVIGLVKSCKSRAATGQSTQASSTTTTWVLNSHITHQTNATSESYQPPVYDPPRHTNPHFEPDSPDHAGVQPTAPVYDEMPHEDVPPPPSYEEAVNNHKQIQTKSNMESPPLHNAAHMQKD